MHSEKRFFRAYNRLDGCHFTYASCRPAGSYTNILDAVDSWNSTHSGYWEIGAPCVVDVREIIR